MGATVVLSIVLQLVQAAATLGPAFQAIAENARQMIDVLFTQKLISKEEQDANKAYVDAVANLVNTGTVPDHWKVEPDPV